MSFSATERTCWTPPLKARTISQCEHYNWWERDPGEIYWMEITDRPDVGGDLWAPQRDAAGRDSWSYTLTSYVQPGDRVFHWHKNSAGEPAIVAWSEAIGPLSVQKRSWQARGTAGRARGVPIVGPAWVMPVRNTTQLDQPITRTQVNARYAEIAEALREVHATSGGAPYAPFQDYGGRELRAQQGYLTKFPASLVHLLIALPALAEPARASITAPATMPRAGRGQAYMKDAEKRSAIELHAVELAREYYIDAGATDIEVLGKPYDLRVRLAGVERHVEVKGATGTEIATVQVTQGEVVHASRWGATDLVVVDSIRCWRDSSGMLSADGAECAFGLTGSHWTTL